MTNSEHVGRVTSVFASVLAILGSLRYLLVVTWDNPLVGSLSDSRIYPAFLVRYFGAAVLAALLLTGAVLLLARTKVGRVLVVVGSALAIALYGGLTIWIMRLAATVRAAHPASYRGSYFRNLVENGPMAGYVHGALLTYCIPAALALVLALAWPTGAWIRRSGRARAPAMESGR